MLNHKKYISLSVEKSNIKNSVKKNASYFARVCKKGKVSREDLVKKVKEKAPYIDIHSFEVGLEVLVESILEYVESGLDVDLFGLGTVGLKGKGSLKVDEAMSKSLEGAFNKRGNESKNAIIKSANQAEVTEENIVGSYEKELTQIAKKDVELAIQFSPSKQIKKHIKEHVEVSNISLKVRKPKIKSIEKVYSGEGTKTPSIIKIKGEDLKVVGESSSLYIKTSDEIFQIPKEAIIHNEPKMLIIVANVPLKEGEEYSIHLSTQYAKMGKRETSIIKRCMKEFRFESTEKIGRKATNKRAG